MQTDTSDVSSENVQDASLEVLRRRAEVLAREIQEERLDGGGRQFIEFQLAGERYAIETNFVREVYPLRELTPLPGTPPFLRGIINIRSSILPVIDIKRFFGLAEIGLSDLNKIIIVHSLDAGHPMHLGILADAIMGVRTVQEVDIQTALMGPEGSRAPYVHGVVQNEGNERLILLDLDAILSDERILINQT